MTTTISDQLKASGVPASLYSMVAALEQNLVDAQQENISLLHLLALIREACGDNGERMQDELVEYIRDERQGHISHIAMLKVSLGKERLETDASRERAKALEDALRPFAKEFNQWEGVGCWDAMTLDEIAREGMDSLTTTYADLRRAAALLEKT